MTATIDLGKEGPHPNVMGSFVEKSNQVFFSDGSGGIREGHVQILQQRSLYGVSWSNLWGVSWAHDGDVIDVDVSVGLVVIASTGSRKRLVMYHAIRLPNRDWNIDRMSGPWLEDPPKKPWTSIPKLIRGLGIAWGVLAHSPDVAKVRLALPDGQVHESPVSHGSALMFVPFNSADLWASSVIYGFYDAQGREIVEEAFPLGSSQMPSS